MNSMKPPANFEKAREHEVEVAKSFFEPGNGYVEWMVDTYWGLMTERVILPAARTIHAALVKQKYTETKYLSWGDADGQCFYVPCKNKQRKAFVFTTQNYNDLYVIQEPKKGLEEYAIGGRLDIRQIYDIPKKDDYRLDELQKDLTIEKVLTQLDFLGELADDHYNYSRRPSLAAYKKVDCEIPAYFRLNGESDKRPPNRCGDFRDPGYVLSYDFFRAKTRPKVEGSTYAFHRLKGIIECDLGCMANDLKVEIPNWKESQS